MLVYVSHRVSLWLLLKKRQNRCQAIYAFLFYLSRTLSANAYSLTFFLKLSLAHQRDRAFSRLALRYNLPGC